VHLSIPEDIHEEECDFNDDDFIAANTKGLKTSSHQLDVENVFDLLSVASRPVIIAGGGVHLSEAYVELKELSETFTIPVGTSINGKGSVAETSAQSIGVIGVNGGSGETNSVIKQADFVLVLGSK